MEWDESKHPRDGEGKFTDKLENNEKKGKRKFSKFINPNIVVLNENNELSRLIKSTNQNKYKAIMNYIVEHFWGKVMTFPDGVEAVIDKNDAKELSHKSNNRRMSELTMLETLIKKSRFENEIDVVHNKFRRFRYYSVKTRFKDKDYEIWLNVGISKNDNSYHLYALTPKK